jgi:DNA-directed RNA polymerase specialized sigma24 family protein
MRGSEADEKLLLRLRSRLVRLAARLGTPADDVDDLVQEALLVFVASPTEVRNPAPWLVGIFLKVSGRYWQNRQAQAAKIEALRLLRSAPCPDLAQVDIRLDLEAMLSQLPALEHRCLFNRYLLDLDTKDLAAAAACHPTTVRRFLRTGLEHMATLWPEGRSLLEDFA